jgi:phage terminase small subunit
MPRVSKHIRDGVTVKQRKLAKNLAKGLSKAESMRKAGYNSNHPTTDANKQLQNTKVVEVMKKEEARLEKIAESKLDNDTLIDKHVELLHAQDESGNNAYAGLLPSSSPRRLWYFEAVCLRR